MLEVRTPGTPAAPVAGGGVSLGPVLSRAALCTVYVLFAYAHLTALAQNGFRLSVALLAGFETVMVGLILVRRPSVAVDRSALAVIAGLVGSFAALGLRPVAGHRDLLAAEVVQVVGVVIQLGASLSIGRSFGLVPANRGIRTGGLYRVVRHPFYAAYLFAEVGYLLNNPSRWNLAVTATGLACQVLRIRYEEALLRGDDHYRRYTTQVRWRLVPGLW